MSLATYDPHWTDPGLDLVFELAGNWRRSLGKRCLPDCSTWPRDPCYFCPGPVAVPVWVQQRQEGPGAVVEEGCARRWAEANWSEIEEVHQSCLLAELARV